MPKRPSSSASISAEHPAVAFHRELLIVQQWSLIRQAFLAELQDTARHGVSWKEPGKLWRHSQEALGKWILSQVARVKGSGAGADPADQDDGETCVDMSMAALHFFPTAAEFAQFEPHRRAYDEQLIRDLTIKCEGGAHDAAIIDKVKTLVEGFDLAARADAAHAVVETQLAEALAYAEDHATASQPFGQHLARPVLQRLEEGDPSRSPSQRRMRGPIAELSVRWPAHLSRPQTRHCPPVSIPWPALQKLRMAYTYYNEGAGARPRADGRTTATATSPRTSPHEDEDITHDPHISLNAEERFLYRAAVVVLRYEGGLATGSLQLCADTSLKQHLHARGYHVMDLCASPINAYMGRPMKGTFLSHEKEQQQQRQAREGTSEARPSSLEQELERPNFFCSAFLDTDRYFGSLGSALRVDPLRMHASRYVNPHDRPLLLTLDVPYDEDLCELLFQKLIADMARAEGHTGTARVDYVLVLPLWWSIPMRIEKKLFSDDVHVNGDTTKKSEDSKGSTKAQSDAVMQVVKERSAMLAEGYQVPYRWPEALAAAAGDATPSLHTTTAQPPWVCFDGLFVGNSGYTYFCTATNRWLQGVTATEVIGLAQPRRHGGDDAPDLLAHSLQEYYLV